jgi:hypothetical protein
MSRRDWLLRQFTRANYALAYCDWYIHRGYEAEGGHGSEMGLAHPGMVAMVTFRTSQELLAFNWALIRLMIRHQGYEGVREIVATRRERLKDEINQAA